MRYRAMPVRESCVMPSALASRIPLDATPPASGVLRGGQLALSALRASGGRVRHVPDFESTSFRLAGGTLVWIGTHAPMHPRVLLVTEDSDCSCFALTHALGEPAKALMAPGPVRVELIKPLVGAILGDISPHSPPGFAPLLAAREPAFPLSHRACAVREAVAAIHVQNPETFELAASRLLGVGGGLTPSGDDVVGGMLFGLHVLNSAAGGDAAARRWQATGLAILNRAERRTHAISAALLRDMASGQTYDALHDLANTIFQADASATHSELLAHATAHARAITAIGHSSGWDMLTGFLGSLTGTLDFTPP